MSSNPIPTRESDPRRPNPLGVAIVLAAALVGYTLCAGVAVAWIFGWIS